MQQLFSFNLHQREGPPPGQYRLSKDAILPKGPNVTSPFKSRTPRFAQPHILVSTHAHGHSVRNIYLISTYYGGGGYYPYKEMGRDFNNFGLKV